MAGDNTVIINTLNLGRKRNAHFREVPIEAEPRRENRFIVEFPTFLHIPSFVIEKITRPKLRFIDNTHQWDDIEICFIDLIGPSTSQGIFRIIEHCKNTELYRAENVPLFSFVLTDVDPTGVDIGSFIIDVKELILADFGNSDYSSQNIQKCKIILKPLNCRLQPVV